MTRSNSFYLIVLIGLLVTAAVVSAIPLGVYICWHVIALQLGLLRWQWGWQFWLLLAGFWASTVIRGEQPGIWLIVMGIGGGVLLLGALVLPLTRRRPFALFKNLWLVATLLYPLALGQNAVLLLLANLLLLNLVVFALELRLEANVESELRV